MSETTSQLLATFDSLPPNEQHELLVALLRKSGELPDTLFSEDALVELADEIFQSLDAGESDDDSRESRLKFRTTL